MISDPTLGICWEAILVSTMLDHLKPFPLIMDTLLCRQQQHWLFHNAACFGVSRSCSYGSILVSNGALRCPGTRTMLLWHTSDTTRGRAEPLDKLSSMTEHNIALADEQWTFSPANVAIGYPGSAHQEQASLQQPEVSKQGPTRRYPMNLFLVTTFPYDRSDESNSHSPGPSPAPSQNAADAPS